MNTTCSYRQRAILALPAIAAALIAVCSPQQASAQQARRSSQSQPKASVASSASSKRAAESNGSLKINSFYPQGESNPAVTIVVQFSADIVSSSTLSTSKSTEGLLMIDPAAEGAAYWTAPREFRYVPRKPLRKGTEYHARVNPQLRDLKGRQIEGNTEFSFQTPELAFENARQVAFTDDRRAVVELAFSDNINPADLRKYLSLTGAGARTLPYALQSDVSTNRPRIITERITTEILSLHIEPGLTGISGPLGLKTAVNKEVPLSMRMVAQELNPRWTRSDASLVIRFSSPADLETAKQFITLEPAIPFELWEEGSTLVLRGDFRPETRYTVRIKDGLKGTNGNLMTTPATLSTWVPRMRPYLSLRDAGGHLSSQGRMKLRVETASIEEYTLWAERVFDNNAIHYLLDDSSQTYRVAKYGHEVASKTYKPTSSAGKSVVTETDLRELLGANASGVFAIYAEAKPVGATEPQEGASYDDQYYDDYYDYESRPRLDGSTLISISNLGIVAKKSRGHMAVWVAGLNSAQPVEGAAVKVFSSRNQLLGEGKTDSRGFVNIENLPKDVVAMQAAAVAATLGDDTSYLSLNDIVESSLDSDEEAHRDFVSDSYEAFLTSERGAYRPGETAHLFGYVRGRSAALPSAGFPLELVVRPPDGKPWEPRTVTPNSAGLIEFDVTVPAYKPTGHYIAELRLPGDKNQSARKRRSGSHYEYDYGQEGDSESEAADPDAKNLLGSTGFFVEDFLPIRLKVSATAEDRRFQATDELNVAVKAEEMFGQAAPNRPVSGVVTYKPQAFQPKEFKGFTFGDSEKKFSVETAELEDLTTDDDGQVSVPITMPDYQVPAALQANIQITVKDNGRGITSKLSRTIDPVPYYIGLKNADETYLKPGHDASFEIVGVKPDESLRTETAELSASIYQVKWNSILKREEGRYDFSTKRELTPVEKLQLTMNDGRTSVSWTPKTVGQYLMQVGDPATSSISSLTFYVSSSMWQDQPWSLEKPEKLELALDKPTYQIGETARVIVKAPFAGTLYLTEEQDRVISATVHRMSENTVELSVPITDNQLPNFYLAATVVKAVTPEAKWMPHRAYGAVSVRVDAPTRVLAVDLTSPEEVRPESKLTATVSLKDAATSQSTKGSVTVWAVDEGVLALTGYETPDPYGFFYEARRLAVKTADFYSNLMPELSETAGADAKAGGDEMAEAARKLSPVPSDRVKPVVLWSGTAETDADGHATVSFSVPQFMGRLRLMAVAAEGSRFGKSDREVFIRNPIMVKENLPRFLAPGDVAEPPFTVYNNTADAHTATLEVSTSGPIQLGEPASNQWKSSVPPSGTLSAHGQQNVKVTLTAAPDKVAQAGITFTGTMGSDSYRESVSLPVRPASAEITVSGIEVIKPGEQKTISLPKPDFMSGSTSASVVVSGMPAVQYAGALNYLLRYPYGCAEQTVSAVFPLLYLGDLAEQINPGKYSRDGITYYVQQGIDRIVSMQTSTGGLAMWPGNREPWDWASVYGAHFLAEAKKAGYQVPDEYMSALTSYLSLLTDGKLDTNNREDLTVRCYALYALAAAGRSDLQKQEKLYEARDSLRPEAVALLASAYQLAGRDADARGLLSGLIGKTMSPDAMSTRSTGGILASPTREAAIILSALLETEPSSPEIPKLVSRLQRASSPKRYYWGTTQDNAFALWALGRYAKAQASGEAAGKLTAEALQVADKDYSSSAPATLTGNELIGSKVSVSAEGTGPTYAFWSVTGVPIKATENVQAQGLSIKRRLATREGETIDASKLRQGQFVMVEIEVATGRSIDNLVIEDLLPAGLEVENVRLKTAESEDSDDDADESAAASDSVPFSAKRLDIRDDRVIGFGDISASGKKWIRFKYGARAVTKGSYVWPAPKASAMYDPDLMAVGQSSRVTVGN